MVMNQSPIFKMMVILLGGHVAFLISELVVELANNSQHFLPSVWHSFLMAKNVCVRVCVCVCVCECCVFATACPGSLIVVAMVMDVLLRRCHRNKLFYWRASCTHTHTHTHT